MNINALAFFDEAKILKRIFNLPVALLLIIIISIFFVDYLGTNVKQFFYSVSLSIKDLLVFFMPCIILAYISSSIIELGRKASWFIALALACVMLSNFFSTFIAYYVSTFCLASNSYFILNKLEVHDSLKPLWTCNLPKFMSNDFALLIGVLWGLAGAFLKIPFLVRLSSVLTKTVSFSLHRIFIPLVPLFVAGFILKLGHEGLLVSISKEYTPVFFVIFITQVSYLMLLYLGVSKFKLSQVAFYLKNVMPSSLTAFCTMSSAASIPVTLKAAEKNTGDAPLSRMLIPGTANIHLIGDSIGVPIMCIAILLSFGFKFPSFADYMAFALQFVLAKFCIAAVPGGGIVVMVPIIEAYLGFSPEMSALVSAFYIFFDPINTSVNVTGNGVFAIMLSKLNNFLKKFSSLSFGNLRTQPKQQANKL